MQWCKCKQCVLQPTFLLENDSSLSFEKSERKTDYKKGMCAEKKGLCSICSIL